MRTTRIVFHDHVDIAGWQGRFGPRREPVVRIGVAAVGGAQDQLPFLSVHLEPTILEAAASFGRSLEPQVPALKGSSGWTLSLIPPPAHIPNDASVALRSAGAPLEDAGALDNSGKSLLDTVAKAVIAAYTKGG